MSASLIKSFAAKYRKTEEEVEKAWNDANRIISSEKTEDYPGYWAMVAFLTKQLLKITEKTDKITFKEFLNSLE
jgi:hypothetical protein